MIVFPHCAWDNFQYGSLVERLGRGRSVLFVTGAQAMTGAPREYGTITLQGLNALDWAHTAVVATHPSWAYEIAGRKPAALIALTPAELENGDESHSRCRDALCASATLVVASSEPFYFEQWFRRGGVFLQDGLDTASDLLVDAAVSDAVAGKSVDALARLQLQRRMDFRAEQLRALRPSAMQYFFQAVYGYLLGKGEEAERWALDAFHLAILTAEEGAVQTYFRFLSAVRLLRERPDDAIATYGISIATDEERSAFEEMSALRAAGETHLAAALLYRMNDDLRQASALLKTMLEEATAGAEPAASPPGTELTRKELDDGASMAETPVRAPATSDSESVPHARPLGRLPNGPAAAARATGLLIESHERSGRPGAALALLEPPRTVKERLRRNLLEGRAWVMEGRRHDAVRALLQAAMTGLEPLHVIAEIASVDAKAKRMAEGDFS
ncbi:hypothetical protein [Paenibacillus glycinis]|uniref:Uncharacterized protein n=1 Tax=Paenibacillus glycinis TaxID=2697035 RepID=A0ABW9XVW2_9BACL|nr:hypothetical protein [Paenibacillus glycinis]NBD26842.1 hypothetical protein [Paenibacillus glycinis]